jgi:hypothetical protein
MFSHRPEQTEQPIDTADALSNYDAEFGEVREWR